MTAQWALGRKIMLATAGALLTFGCTEPAADTGKPMSSSPALAATSSVVAPATTTPAPPATPPVTVATISDGTWTVGEDIPVGTYKVVGAESKCYWSITKSGSNGRDIIDNHIGGGNLRVTLKTGQDFESKRCGTWQKTG